MRTVASSGRQRTLQLFARFLDELRIDDGQEGTPYIPIAKHLLALAARFLGRLSTCDSPQFALTEALSAA